MATGRESLATLIFGEIAMAEQLARTRLSRVLPRGMELSHFMVLNHLCQVQAERTPAELARVFQLTRAAMTNTLRRLERAGHVHVRPDWDDGRRKLVSISPSGRQARDYALGAITPFLEEVMRPIGEERLRAALPVLRDLRQRLGKA